MSPQAAIAAGLDSRAVYQKWAAAINKYPSANAAIAAGVPAGVATQLWGSPCGCRRKRKLFGLGQDDHGGVVIGTGSPYDTINIAVAAQQATAAQTAAQINSGPVTQSLTQPQAPYPTSLAPGTVTNYRPRAARHREREWGGGALGIRAPWGSRRRRPAMPRWARRR